MSVLGTNLAAGVAGVALNAQQLAQAKDKHVREKERPTRKLQDTYDTHLRVLEEHEEGEAAPRLVVDDRLQESPHPPPPDRDAGGEPRKRLDVTG